MEGARDYGMVDVDAVAFTDMNKDGFSDITILLSCYTGVGPDGAGAADHNKEVEYPRPLVPPHCG
ncbi:MAG: hypothetical protein P8107_09955 [Spirochaetia bacterium]